MRQRTLGILAAAFLIAGAALGAGTAVYAFRSGVTGPPGQDAQTGQLHHHRFEGPGQQPGFGPGSGPARQPGFGPGSGPAREPGAPGF